MTHQVANTILAQLGGNKFLAMTGASNLTGSERALSFKVGRNVGKVSHVRINLSTVTDDYEVSFMNIRGTTVKVVKYLAHVQADQLAPAFVEATGLAVRL